MRFLILNTDYTDFLRLLYDQHLELEKRSYDEQLRVRMDSLCGMSDFYSSNLGKLGHEAYDIIANAERMQKAWAREHGKLAVESSPAERNIRAAVQPVRKLLAATPFTMP